MWKRPSVPKGAGLFGEAEPERKAIASYQANVDGGSRGNPGPAAYGVVVRDPRGEIVARLKKYIGKNTNNVAEYFGLIAALDFFVLEDDRHYFPPYEAVPVIREATLQQHPEVAQALAGLEGKISDREMRQLNYAVDGQHRDVKEVVRDFLRREVLAK